MKGIFIDCPTGIAGDMLLAGFLDLGVPLEVLEAPIGFLGLDKLFNLRVEEKISHGLKGARACVKFLQEEETRTYSWNYLKELISNM